MVIKFRPPRIIKKKNKYYLKVNRSYIPIAGNVKQLQIITNYSRPVRRSRGKKFYKKAIKAENKFNSELIASYNRTIAQLQRDIANAQRINENLKNPTQPQVINNQVADKKADREIKKKISDLTDYAKSLKNAIDKLEASNKILIDQAIKHKQRSHEFESKEKIAKDSNKVLIIEKKLEYLKPTEIASLFKLPKPTKKGWRGRTSQDAINAAKKAYGENWKLILYQADENNLEDTIKKAILNFNENAEEGVLTPDPVIKDSKTEGDEELMEGSGSDKPLDEEQIREIMKSLKAFKGVYSIDEIYKLQSFKPPFCFIMNLSPRNKRGTHWVAINITLDSVEYYDSLADEPPIEFFKGLKKLMQKIDPDIYYKLKINKIREQSNTSNTCGWFAVKFLIDRYKGKKFKDITGYTDLKENEINEFKTKFPYI